MKILHLLSSGFLCLISVCIAFSQESPSARYIGRMSSGEVFINVPRATEVSLAHFDYVNRRVETGTGTLVRNGVTTFATNLGRIVSLAISAQGVSGTIGGVGFAATVIPVLGPFANRAFTYSGTVFDPQTRDSAVVLQRIFPDGRVAIFVSSAVLSDGGVGTISGNGVVAVQLVSGRSWNYLFVVVDGAASGVIPVSGFQSLSFFLAQVQRAALVNIATRGVVGGGSMLIAGFVITDYPKTLLIRGVGPALAGLGVQNVQNDPSLALFSGQTVIATNNDWWNASNASDITTAARQVGAFAFPSLSRDAAMIVTLEPGAYTAQVTGAGPASDALVEVYEIR